MMKTEYDVLGIPKPDVNIILLVPSRISQENIDKKEARAYTERKRDIHEEDAEHLDRTKANYEELAQLYLDKFVGIDCMQDDGQMLSIDAIQSLVQRTVDSFISN